MNRLRFAFFTALIVITLCLTAVFSFLILEPKVYDYMLQHVLTERLPFDTNKNVYGHDDVVLVMIDDKSIEKYRWPWKRDLNNKVLGYFKDYAKPKVLVHDSIFITLDTDNPVSDKKYFETIGQIQNLIEGVMFSTTSYVDEKQGELYDKKFTKKFSIQNIDINTEMPNLYSSILISPDEYFNKVSNIGSITMISGFLDGHWSIYLGDETYRTHEYLINYKGAVFPSLAMKSFLCANNNPKIVIDDKYISFPELDYKIRYIKTPFQTIVPIKFYKRLPDSDYTHKSYSAVDIMDSYDNIRAGKKPIINPEEFKDKIVIYGANVTVGNGLNDNKKSPIAIYHPGADIQATSIDNIFHNDFLKVLPLWVNILISLIAMSCVFFAIKTHNLIKSINYSILVLLILILGASICYYNGIVLALITPIALCLYTIMLTYINRYIIEEKNRRKVTNALGRYMSEDVMKKVIQNIDNLGLGGKKATVTVLFSDIRGFTSLSENLTAQDVSQLLNEYFSQMEPIVSKYNGIINKFIGDAIMAVFGEPIQDENHAENAVKCGYEMLKKVEELNNTWQKEGKYPIKIGIGINTGEVFIGNIGSEKRMEYTVIGDTVNLASRLESYNKIYKTQMLISSETYEKAKNIADVNKFSDVEIRGKIQKIDIYEVKDVFEKK